MWSNRPLLRDPECPPGSPLCSNPYEWPPSDATIWAATDGALLTLPLLRASAWL